MEILYTWIGFIVFWVAALCVGLAALLAILFAFMAMFEIGLFGFVPVRVENFWRYREVYYRVMSAHRWMSGFRDLDIIWDHILQGEPSDIGEMRARYARARGTNLYGRPLTSFVDHTLENIDAEN